MTEKPTQPREGSVDAPTRHPIEWRTEEFFDEARLLAEMERVFDICHGCRRCFSLCHSFPLLFDAVDESETGEVDGLGRETYWHVAEHCYLCDMCYMSKCPYVPPHPFNVDFPHLMLRAKAQRFKKEGARHRDRVLTSTDAVGRIAGIPVVAQAVNALNRSKGARKIVEKTLGVHRDARLPEYAGRSLKARLNKHEAPALPTTPTDRTKGRVALFGTCYGNRNMPELGEDLVAIFEHNGIPVRDAGKERCCGMPKLELGDLDAVDALKEHNIPLLAALVDEGWDIVAPIPSCVLMFKQELPLMYPDDADVQKVRAAMFDPFEYLMLRQRAGLLKTDFRQSLGDISYHVACHLRVQNIGMKTRDVLQLVPDTRVKPIERCSGHNGTYAVKKECHDLSMRIGRPVMRRVEQDAADHYASDCPMAGHQIENGLENARPAIHPLKLLRTAYGI